MEDIHITDINTLRRLSDNFNELSNSSYYYFDKVQQDIDKKVRSVKEWQYKLQLKLEDANARVYNAEMALTIAKRQTYIDENGKTKHVSTSSEQNAVSRASAGQKTARKNLHTMDGIMDQVQSYLSRYQPLLSSTKDMSIHFSQKSASFIQEIERVFNEYVEAGNAKI